MPIAVRTAMTYRGNGQRAEGRKAEKGEHEVGMKKNTRNSLSGQKKKGKSSSSLILFLPLPLLLSLLLLMLCIPHTVHAQTGTNGTDNTNGTAFGFPLSDFAVHVPPKMISGEAYEGMLMFREPVAYDVSISFASDDSAILIPANARVPAGSNQILFPISPGRHADDIITINVITADGMSAYATSEVYSISSEYTSLLIAAPSSGDDGDDKTVVTSSRLVPIEVFLADNHGIPVMADRDIPVGLSSSSSSAEFATTSGFDETLDIAIRNGTYSTKATVRVNGDGLIYAVSDGLESDSVRVTYRPAEIDVRMGVAPNPAAENSMVHFYVWLEQDGSVYKSDRQLDVFVSSGSTDHIAFGATAGNEKHHLYMPRDAGIARGQAFAKQAAENVTMHASVPGYGSASAEISIMPVPTDAVLSLHTDDILEGSNTRSEFSRISPNVLQGWVFPETPADRAWSVIGLYHDRTLSNDTRLEDYESDLIPLYTAGQTITLANNGGLMHAGTADDTKPSDLGPSVRRSSFEVPITVQTSSGHVLTASEKDAIPTDIIFDSRPVAGREHSIRITPIPANFGVHGPIAFASIVDGDLGVITDTGGATDPDAVRAMQVGDSLRDLDIDWNWIGGSTVLSGTHVDEGARVHVQIPGVESSPADLHVAGIQTGIEMWFPSHANTGMEFPVTIHAVDDAGVPVRLIRDADEFFLPSGGQIRVADSDPIRFVAGNDGQTDISIITGDKYLATRSLQSFSNEITTNHVSVKQQTPSVLRLGSEIILDLFTSALGDDADIMISGLDFEQSADGLTYVAKPKTEGKYDVTVTVTKEGWLPYKAKMEYSVERLIDVSLDVIADDGVSIGAVMDVTHSATGTQTILKNGFMSVLQPGIYEVATESEHRISDDRIYTLQEISVNGKRTPHADVFTLDMQQNTVLSATYHREVDVSYVALADLEEYDDRIAGNGKYRYGDAVRLVAPSYPEMFGLIWHVPSMWINLPADARYSGDTAAFEAVDSVSGYVEYERNYVAMIALIASATVVPLLIIYKKSPDSLMNLADYVRGLAAKANSAKMPKRPKLADVGRMKRIKK